MPRLELAATTQKSTASQFPSRGVATPGGICHQARTFGTSLSDTIHGRSDTWRSVRPLVVFDVIPENDTDTRAPQFIAIRFRGVTALRGEHRWVDVRTLRHRPPQSF